jgi:hypothetical protein
MLARMEHLPAGRALSADADDPRRQAEDDRRWKLSMVLLPISGILGVLGLGLMAWLMVWGEHGFADSTINGVCVGAISALVVSVITGCTGEWSDRRHAVWVASGPLALSQDEKLAVVRAREKSKVNPAMPEIGMIPAQIQAAKLAITKQHEQQLGHAGIRDLRNRVPISWPQPEVAPELTAWCLLVTLAGKVNNSQAWSQNLLDEQHLRLDLGIEAAHIGSSLQTLYEVREHCNQVWETIHASGHTGQDEQEAHILANAASQRMVLWNGGMAAVISRLRAIADYCDELDNIDALIRRAQGISDLTPLDDELRKLFTDEASNELSAEAIAAMTRELEDLRAGIHARLDYLRTTVVMAEEIGQPLYTIKA